jgi:hypothetical protein
MRAINYEEISKYLSYDPDTGILTNIKHRGDLKAGDICGYIQSNGYLQLKINNRQYLVHRVAWVLHHGKDIPDNMTVDHINENKHDNRIVNLRLMSKENNSGIKGVNGNKPRGIAKGRNGKWRAKIKIQGRNYYGTYRVCPLVAHIDYQELIPSNR